MGGAGKIVYSTTLQAPRRTVDGDRRHDIKPVRPPVAAHPAPPRPSAVLHLDPEAVLADLGAQSERAAVPGGAVQHGVGGELRGDQDRLVGPAVAVRDSKHPDGPLLTFPGPWQAFTDKVKRGGRLRP